MYYYLFLLSFLYLDLMVMSAFLHCFFLIRVLVGLVCAYRLMYTNYANSDTLRHFKPSKINEF